MACSSWPRPRASGTHGLRPCLLQPLFGRDIVSASGIHGRGPRAPTASGLACCSRCSAEIMFQPQGFRARNLKPHDVLKCSCSLHESGLYELIGLSEYVIFPRPPRHWGAATAGAPQYWRSAETEPARLLKVLASDSENTCTYDSADANAMIMSL